MFWIIVIFFIILSLTKKHIEYFYEPDFMTKEHMESIVNASSYFNRMNALDLRVRNVESIEQYKHEYINSVIDFTSEEKTELAALCEQIDKKMKTNRLYKIKWKFAKVYNHIEDGYPHTLKDVIILPANFLTSDSRTPENKMITLIHEKIHVYQRIYPDETNILYQSWGFQEVYLPSQIKEIRRNNPDVNKLYHKNNYALIQIYNENPFKLAHSKPMFLNIHTNKLTDQPQYPLPDYVNQTENPNEIMAVIIPLIYFKHNKGDDYFIKTKLWCDKYL